MAIQTKQNLYFYGSALSPDRCAHYVKLCHFASNYFSEEYTYNQLRVEAEANKILGDDAIRTFIPIFKGLGFVSYERKSIFSYSNDGLLFYHIQKALQESQNLSDDKRETVISLLMDARLHLIWKGLVHLYKNDDDNSRKFQIIINLLDHFGEVSVQEYLYAINYSLENDTIDYAVIINVLQERRKKGLYDDILSWNNRSAKFEHTKDTATSYLKDLLRTAGLIVDVDSVKFTASNRLPIFLSLL